MIPKYVPKAKVEIYMGTSEKSIFKKGTKGNIEILESNPNISDKETNNELKTHFLMALCGTLFLALLRYTKY